MWTGNMLLLQTFPGTYLDETEYAKSVVDSINIKADYVEIDPVPELNDYSPGIYV